MSDSNTSGETPAGGPPPQPNPYGQPAGQDPYGQPPAGPAYGEQPQQPAYGQQPGYGQPPAYGQQPGYPSAGDPDKRPGTVTAAGVITMIFSGLALLLFGVVLVGMLVARDQILDALEGDADFDSMGISGDSAFGAIVAVMAVFALWCVIAFVLGLMVMRRSNAARIALVVSAALSAVISLVGIGSGVSALTLIASVAVIVLLFTGGASPWFKRSSGQPGPY